MPILPKYSTNLLSQSYHIANSFLVCHLLLFQGLCEVRGFPVAYFFYFPLDTSILITNVSDCKPTPFNTTCKLHSSVPTELTKKNAKRRFTSLGSSSDTQPDALSVSGHRAGSPSRRYRRTRSDDPPAANTQASALFAGIQPRLPSPCGSSAPAPHLTSPAGSRTYLAGRAHVNFLTGRTEQFPLFV